MDLDARARAVKLAIFDVDGVMTDGTLFIGPQGEALKAFNIRRAGPDAAEAGIATAIFGAQVRDGRQAGEGAHHRARDAERRR